MGVVSVMMRWQQGWATCERRGACLCAMLLMPVLAGCDQLGIDTPAKVEERLVAESKAIGVACRHAMRAIEDCYTMNPKAQKAAIAGGWREMDEYMRENKIEGVAPTIARAVPGRQAKPADGEEDIGSDDGTATADEGGASKSRGDAGGQPEQSKSGKAGTAAEDADKTGKVERGDESKNKRDKRDTLHAEAGASQPH